MGVVICGVAKKVSLIIAGIWCAFVAMIMIFVYAKLDLFGHDFVVYWTTANLPVSWAYTAYERSPFPYMPTMLLFIQPLAFIPKNPAFIGWVIFSAFFFTWQARKHLTWSENLLALASKPVIFCLLTGQVSVFLAAMLLWAFGTERKVLAGISLGFVASVKPQLLILAPLLLLLRRDVEIIIASAVTFAAIILAALLAFGFQSWIDWLNSLEHFRSVLNASTVLRASVSPAGWAEHWGYNPVPVMTVGAAFGAWLVYRCRNLGPVEVTAAVVAGSIFASPYALLYDMAAVVPFLVVTVFRQNRLTSALAVIGRWLPLPIFLAAYELMRVSRNANPSEVLAIRYSPRAALRLALLRRG